MKRFSYHFYPFTCQGGTWLFKIAFVVLMMFMTLNISAQSGGWDGSATNGTTGYVDHGNGVIQLLSTASTGCASAAVHETSDTYDPTSGSVFSKCYQLYFGCPENDNIGSDQKGDGMAFSFWKGGYNINNGLACGGGLGYMGSNAQMITIEFDTWSSQGNSGFDATYGGGTSGSNDEIAIQRDGIANDGGRLTAVNAGNLEDGLEHTVCITYTPVTRILAVTIDGNTILSYDLGPTYNLQTYFGAGGLSQTWSSGKFGATNPATVSNGFDISNQIGAPLCPAGVTITSPSNGSTYGGCSAGPINISATAIPPAGNTVSYVEFYVDGVSVGTDNSAPYSYNWSLPTNGNHALTARAYFSGGTNQLSSAVNITVGGGLYMTSTAPTINGAAEALWNSYPTMNLTQGYNSAPDLAAFYKIMFDATNLYILVDVTDEDLRNDSGNDWEDDGVEIFIDIGNDKVGCCSYGLNDYQYGLKYNDAAPAEYKHAPGSLTGVTFSQGAKAGGYIMEVRIPWSTLGGTPTPGTYLGFDVKLNDDDGGGGRDNELAWNDGSFGSWQNPSLFGTLQFLSCDPLPVNLLNFSGERDNETVVLTWSTTEEINNDRFIIERTTDMIHWEVVGEVPGSGNVSTFKNYSFTDFNPLDGIVYYRLRQIDFDGVYTYSNVVVVKSTLLQMSIEPNPFDHVLLIKGNLNGEVTIEIYDVLGRMVYVTNGESENGSLRVEPGLSSGPYLLTVRTEEFMEQWKVIKK